MKSDDARNDEDTYRYRGSPELNKRAGVGHAASPLAGAARLRANILHGIHGVFKQEL